VLACADGGPNIAALMQQRAVHIEAGQVSTSPMPSVPRVDTITGREKSESQSMF
jgi:hypothetical protein